MLDNYYQIMAENYREQRLQEAEQERLVRLTKPQKKKHSTYFRNALIWLGKQMVLRGTQLLEQFDSSQVFPNGTKNATP
jgi:hypothetical protein